MVVGDNANLQHYRLHLEEENIHIGPSDYVPWQNDNKVCYLRMEGRDVFKHAGRSNRIVVPHPRKDLGVGLVAAIRKQAGL